EPGGELRVHSQEVVHHQHLPVAIRTGADTDGGNADAPGDLRTELGRNRLEDERVAAGLLQRPGVLDEPRRLVLATALYHVPAELVDRLRREPDVAHHGDAGAHDALDDLAVFRAAFELDRLHVPLGDDPDRVLHRLVGA